MKPNCFRTPNFGCNKAIKLKSAIRFGWLYSCASNRKYVQAWSSTAPRVWTSLCLTFYNPHPGIIFESDVSNNLSISRICMSSLVLWSRIHVLPQNKITILYSKHEGLCETFTCLWRKRPLLWFVQQHQRQSTLYRCPSEWPDLGLGAKACLLAHLL